MVSNSRSLILQAMTLLGIPTCQPCQRCQHGGCMRPHSVHCTDRLGGLHAFALHAAGCRNHWVQQDLEQFLPPDQARECFATFDWDEDGKCSLGDVRAAVTAIYKVGKNIPCSTCARQLRPVGLAQLAVDRAVLFLQRLNTLVGVMRASVRQAMQYH